METAIGNARVPREWEGAVNHALDAAAGDYANVTLVDWYSASAGHDEYFGKDGVHLVGEGAKAYASLIVENISQDLQDL